MVFMEADLVAQGEWLIEVKDKIQPKIWNIQH
jgi:hypothetical protein